MISWTKIVVQEELLNPIVMDSNWEHPGCSSEMGTAWEWWHPKQAPLLHLKMHWSGLSKISEGCFMLCIVLATWTGPSSIVYPNYVLLIDLQTFCHWYNHILLNQLCGVCIYGKANLLVVSGFIQSAWEWSSSESVTYRRSDILMPFLDTALKIHTLLLNSHTVRVCWLCCRRQLHNHIFSNLNNLSW